ncbi:laminin subunit gamma-1-like [Bolinopsis microptera]|uniref:laminin subunit gamma-1-like n=1 Tax=Bolinopsis microptera TaxID=2820187 RepID=UPI003079DD89
MWSQLVILISLLLFCFIFGSLAVPENDLVDPWEIFNRLSSKSNGSFVSWEEVENARTLIDNPVYNETGSDDGEKVTFPDFMLNPDSWEMGSRVVDAIIRDNTATKSSVGAVYPGLMELLRIKVKVQCSGRDCDHNIDLVTSSTGHFITLPLFGRTHVIITIILSQEFEVHQMELNLMTQNHKYHFKVRQRSSKGKRTMFEISNKLSVCGVDFDSNIRDLCREKSSFQYGGDEPSRLDFGADQGTTSVSQWVNTRALEIVLLPVSGGPTVYGINNLKLFGRCICNGHGSECSLVGSEYHCTCQGNTCGSSCESCCPKYNAYPWEPANSTDPNSCTECLCYGKASSCHYERSIETQYRSYISETQRGGGGVCDGCTGDSAGINCETCKPRFYRPANLTAWAPFPCIACDCHMRGVVRMEGWPDGDCVKDSSFSNIQGKPMTAGQCFCREGWTGRRCDVCSDGWYLSGGECSPCECSVLGSVSETCDQDSGECECRVGYRGRTCGQCTERKFSFPKCTESCSENRAGVRCETCLDGFYLDGGQCRACKCSPHSSCDRSTGACSCLDGYVGPSCDSCVSELLPYPDCRNCSCNHFGTKAGCVNCQCKDFVEGSQCDGCKAGHFALSPVHETGCLPCFCSHVSAQCSPAVTASSFVSSLFDYTADGWELTGGSRTSASPSSSVGSSTSGIFLSTRVFSPTSLLQYSSRLPPSF